MSSILCDVHFDALFFADEERRSAYLTHPSPWGHQFNPRVEHIFSQKKFFLIVSETTSPLFLHKFIDCVRDP